MIAATPAPAPPFQMTSTASTTPSGGSVTPRLTDISGWDTGRVLNFLRDNRHQFDLDENDISAIRGARINGVLLVNSSSDLFKACGVRPDQAGNIESYFNELKKAAISLIIPPATPASTIKTTPTRTNSCTGYIKIQTREFIDPLMRGELRNNVYKDVTGLYTYFSDLSCTQWDCAIKCPEVCVCPPCPGMPPPWPTPPSENHVLQWFHNFNRAVTLNGPVGHTRFYTSPRRNLEDSKCSRQCDVFISKMLTDKDGSEIQPNNNHQYSWRDVLVCGELKSNENEDCTPDTVIQLAGYVREVFGSQVGRRFVHAFTICGDKMRCYLFDRAGVSSSEAFRITKNEKTLRLFSHIMYCYATMDAAQMGFDPGYVDNDNNIFIPSSQQRYPAFVKIKDKRFEIVDMIFYRPAIVSRGTLCWLAKNEEGRDCVVKDAWRSKYRISEGELMRCATDSGAWGAVDCVLHDDITIDSHPDEIASNIRKDLSYDKAKRIKLRIIGTEGLQISETVTGTSNTSKRRLPGQGSKTSKRQKTMAPSSAELPESTSGEKDGDRVHTRLVFNSVGKPIETFTSVKHLLEVFRDATKCHQNLFEKANILHRDISINNIMISKNPADGKPRGFLIDLDMAVRVNTYKPSGAPHRTGTMAFIAVQVLKGNALHSWRHDLESFFYVFIWICCLYEQTQEGRRQMPLGDHQLQKWYGESAAAVKEAMISFRENFKSILDDFLPNFECLKLMMWEWRELLFPLQGGERFSGTPENHSPVYDKVIKMFDKQICSLSDLDLTGRSLVANPDPRTH